eukprot:SAG22_NODE_3399_length_1734_cov_1.549847_1_plen_418_part_00
MPRKAAGGSKYYAPTGDRTTRALTQAARGDDPAVMAPAAAAAAPLTAGGIPAQPPALNLADAQSLGTSGRSAAGRLRAVAVAIGAGGHTATGSLPASSIIGGGSLLDATRELVSGFGGTATVFARNLQTGECCAVDADRTMPTASLVKVPILAVLLQRVQDGQLRYTEPVAFSKEACLHHPSETQTDGGEAPAFEPYPDGEDIFARFRAGASIPLAMLAMLMTSFSDNHASLCLQRLTGGGAAINSWLTARGYCATRVNSRTAGRATQKARWGWGQTTAREMAELTTRVCCGTSWDNDRSGGSWLGDAACAEAHRLLSRSFYSSEALSALPPDTPVASKQGAVDASRSEVVLVSSDSGPVYVFCAITAEQRDTRWVADNEGNRFLRSVSALLWEAWGPDMGKKPQERSSIFALEPAQ